MKWFLSLAVLAATVTICGVLGVVAGLIRAPSLEEGSHGMFFPLTFGAIGCYCGIPIGFIVAILWLVRRNRREKMERELVKEMTYVPRSLPSPPQAREAEPNK